MVAKPANSVSGPDVHLLVVADGAGDDLGGGAGEAAGGKVNCLAPGFILTDLTRELRSREEMQRWLRGAQGNPRMGTPEDIAPAAVFLASSGSDYITGQVVMVDGGFSAGAVWPFEP
jgi:NAD(P)-dependent dehydrogenase (short-subunit alcohol dehydrogenase family)